MYSTSSKSQSATHICLINPKRVVADWPMEKSDSFFGPDVWPTDAHAPLSVLYAPVVAWSRRSKVNIEVWILPWER